MNTITFDGGVKRQFALPAAIVLSAHGAFFLGFIHNPSAAPHLPKYTVIHFDPPPPPPIVESGSDADKPEGGSPSRPQLPEVCNPISTERPDMPEIPITPVLLSTDPISSHPWSPPNGPDNATGPGAQTFGQEMLDHTPEAVKQPQPIYPLDAQIKSQSGEVEVVFIVDESGRVLNPRVVRSTDPIFEEPTLRAIEQWRFAPGTLHGVPVRFRMSVPVAFHLES